MSAENKNRESLDDASVKSAYSEAKAYLANPTPEKALVICDEYLASVTSTWPGTRTMCNSRR